MGDVPIREVEPTEAERRERALRIAIAGHPQGQVRRIMLYAALAFGIVLTASTGIVGLFVALPVFVILMATDSLV